MDLYTELNNLLNDDSEPLTKRIRLAKNVFISNSLFTDTKDCAMESKEEKALRWLCDYPQSEEARLAFQRCLCCDRVKNYKYLYLSQATRNAVILKLCEALTNEKLKIEEKNLFLQSSICLLDVVVFKQHFRRCVSDYTALIGSILKFFTEIKTPPQDVCVKVIDNLKSYSQNFLLNDEYSRCFYTNILCPLSEILTSDEIRSFDSMSSSMYKCIGMTLFPKKKLEHEFRTMNYIIEQSILKQEVETEDGSFIHHFLQTCLTLPINQLDALVHVVFKAFIRSCRKENRKHCQMFLILCYGMGIHPREKNEKFHISPKFSRQKQVLSISNQSENTAHLSLKTAIDVLNSENVDITAEISGYPFLKWLQCLCDFIVSTEQSVEASTIELLTSLSDLDPNILDSHKVTAIGHVMFNKSEKTKQTENSSYVMFLRSLLRSSIKLHRVQKLASRLLSSAKEQLAVEGNGMKLTANEVFPEEFLNEFKASMQTLVATQAMAMLKTLTFHLLEDCVEPMEKGNIDPDVVLMLLLTSYLINHFLTGYRAIDPNIPQSKMGKLISLMGDLGNAIGRLGKVLLLGKHDPVTVGAFLDMSLCWGDLQLSLIFYQPDNPSALTEFPPLPSANKQSCRGPSTATDFSLLHMHLTDGDWSHLVERIVNFGDDHCKRHLNELVMQKLRTLLLFEPEVKTDKSVSCAHYLISKASDTPSTLSLIANNIDTVAQMLNFAELAKLSELFVRELSNEMNDLLKQLHRNSAIFPILTLTVLKEIGKKGFKNYYDVIKTRKRRHSASDERSSILEAPSTKGTRLSFNLFSAVDEAMTAVLEEHSGIKQSTTLLQADAATLLSTKLALLLHEYFSGLFLEDGSQCEEPLIVDYTPLNKLLSVLRSLPLSCLSDSSRAIVIMSLISLLFALREHPNGVASTDAEVNVLEVILLTVNSNEVFKELVKYLNIGKFLAWYVCRSQPTSLDSSHETMMKLKCLQEQLMEKFIAIGMTSAVGFEQLKEVIKAIREELKKENYQLDLINLISPLLMAFLAEKCSKSSIKPGNKKVYIKYYKLLSFNLVKALNFDLSTIDQQKLECYTLMLRNFLSIKSQKRISKCGEHLEELLAMVGKRLSSSEKGLVDNSVAVSSGVVSKHLKSFNSCCFHFLEILSNHRVALKEYLSPSFVSEVWEMLISFQNCAIAEPGPFSRLLKALLMSCNKKEFVLLTKDLLVKLENIDQENPDPRTLNHYMRFWKILIKCSLNKGLAECRLQTIKDSLPLFLSMVNNWKCFEENRNLICSAVSILEFEDVLLKKGKVFVDYPVIHLVFKSILVIPLSDVLRHESSSSVSTNHDIVSEELSMFHKLFSACSNCLLAIVNQHPDHLIDRIPSFLKCLFKLFMICVSQGNVEYSSAGGLQGGKLSEHLLVMTDCASNVEWITNALVKFKKHFTRVSQYFITNAVMSFESKPIHPAIKVHLQNCINGFIHMCDNNGLAYLLSSLPPGSKEIFKTLFENYKKYYKFKGKI